MSFLHIKKSTHSGKDWPVHLYIEHVAICGKQTSSYFFLLKLQYMNFNAGHHKQTPHDCPYFPSTLTSISILLPLPVCLTSFFLSLSGSFIFFPLFLPFQFSSLISLLSNKFRAEMIPSLQLYSQLPGQFLVYDSYSKKFFLHEHMGKASRIAIVLVLFNCKAVRLDLGESGRRYSGRVLGHL